jgi:hypothetical protein
MSVWSFHIRITNNIYTRSTSNIQHCLPDTPKAHVVTYMHAYMHTAADVQAELRML